MEKLSASLKWIDEHILKVLTVIFIYLIPLYPKFPLQILPDTYIAIRLEDMFMVVFCLVFLVQLLRKKITLNKTFLVLFAAYWIAVFLSFFWGHFVQKTILFNYVGFLHAARRVEYMAVFFIVASIVRSKKDVYFYMLHITITALLVCLYGIGQKFIGLPAIQTMNKEFAKGITLFLTPEARVSSTFAGHYDLAAYIVLMLPAIIGFHLNRKYHWIVVVVLLAISILVLTASRSSYGAFIIATFGFLLMVRAWKYFLLVLVFTAILTMSSDSLTSRFAQTFRVKQLFVNQQTGQVLLPQNISTSELPAGTSFVAVGKGATDAEKASSAALLQKQLLRDIRLEASMSGKKLSEDEEQALLASRLGGFTPVVGVAADISFATRLQVEWPRAVESFMKNPILGTGPSSITESTDNSFLRWLGEFGLLGSSLFMSILISIFWLVVKNLKKMAHDDRTFYLGFLFGLIGLAINGTYIDVFEASKVAYTLWLVSGLFIGGLPFFLAKKNE